MPHTVVSYVPAEQLGTEAGIRLTEPQAKGLRLAATIYNRGSETGARALPLAVSALMAAVSVLGCTAAHSAEDMFKGKTINLIIAAGEGGGFDIAARVAAQHLGKFLPGHPTIVPQNMPGANGIRATEYLFRIAPRDGLAVGLLQPLMVLNKVLDPAARYDPQEFTWIGRINSSPNIRGVMAHCASALDCTGARDQAHARRWWSARPRLDGAAGARTGWRAPSLLPSKAILRPTIRVWRWSAARWKAWAPPLKNTCKTAAGSTRSSSTLSIRWVGNAARTRRTRPQCWSSCRTSATVTS